MTPCSDFLRFLVCVYAAYLFVVVVFGVCVCVCVTACDVFKRKREGRNGVFLGRVLGKAKQTGRTRRLGWEWCLGGILWLGTFTLLLFFCLCSGMVWFSYRLSVLLEVAQVVR